jgi:hypothetical protein
MQTAYSQGNLRFVLPDRYYSFWYFGLDWDCRFAILAGIDFYSNLLFWSRLSHFVYLARLRQPSKGTLGLSSTSEACTSTTEA